MSFQMGPVITKEASLVRHVHPRDSKRGKFVSSGDLVVSPSGEDKERWTICLTLRIRAEDEVKALALECSCTGETSIKLAQAADELPKRIVDEVATRMFFILAERSRNLIAWAGYPSSSAGTIRPTFAPIAEEAPPAPRGAAKVPTRAKPRTPAAKKVSSKT